RSADRGATLVLPDPGSRLLEEGTGIERVVIEVVINAGVRIVGAGADGHVGEPASRPPVFGAEGVGDNTELPDLLDRRAVFLNRAACIALAGRSAVQKDLGVPGIGSVDARIPRRGVGDARQ